MTWIQENVRRLRAWISGRSRAATSGYPSHCLRGIRAKKWIAEQPAADGRPRLASDAFVPDGKRPNGDREASINWEDDAGALETTLADRTNAEHGAARLPLEALEHVSALPACLGAFAYERSPLQGNPYHGNLIYAASLAKQIERMIAASLALQAVVVERK